MVSTDIFIGNYCLRWKSTSDHWISDGQCRKRCFHSQYVYWWSYSTISKTYNKRQSLRSDNQVPLTSYTDTNIQLTNSAHLLASGDADFFSFRLHPSASQVLSSAFQQLVIIYQPLPGQLSSGSCRLGRQTSAMFYICCLRYWDRRKW